MADKDKLRETLKEVFDAKIPEIMCELKKMDNKKLLWLLMQTTLWKNLKGMMDIESLILEEISERLYPEFDGASVFYTDTGWKTPEGEINYI